MMILKLSSKQQQLAEGSLLGRGKNQYEDSEVVLEDLKDLNGNGTHGSEGVSSYRYCRALWEFGC